MVSLPDVRAFAIEDIPCAASSTKSTTKSNIAELFKDVLESPVAESITDLDIKANTTAESDTIELSIAIAKIDGIDFLIRLRVQMSSLFLFFIIPLKFHFPLKF